MSSPHAAATGMRCDDAATALLLGDDPVASRRARRHQRQCPRCHLGPGPLADGGGDVIDRSALPLPPRTVTVLLAVLGALHALTAGPWLLGTDPAGLLGDVPLAHQVRDGAFGSMVAVAALLTAWRPRWAQPSFAIASIAIVIQAAAGMADRSIVTSGANEIVHVLTITTTCLIGLAALRLAVLGPERRGRLQLLDDPSRRASDN
jgi:hypothetical protein